MNRPLTVIGAPSSIGIRPYDDGRARRLDLAPAALRDEGLLARLRARDLGDVVPPPYHDFVRRPGAVRNEEGVAAYSQALADRVAAAAARGGFVLVLGGDCSIVLGCLLGLRRPGEAPPGLAYVDAHADFATPDVSRSGSAASMCLALAVGRGASPLARLQPGGSLVRERDVVVIGRRDDGEKRWYGEDELRASEILDLPLASVRERGPADTARAALDRLTGAAPRGYWIHVDADVFDPAVMPAVDSPEPDGFTLDELADCLGPLVQHPRALGLQLTIYDPALDPDRSCARLIVSLLERVFARAADTSFGKPAAAGRRLGVER